MGLGGEVDDRLAVAHRLGNRLGILDRPLDETDLLDHLTEVLATTGVGELVEHRDLVAVIAHAQAHERRTDEAGAAADEQFHVVPTVAVMYSANPARQCGIDGASARPLGSEHAVRRPGRRAGHLGRGGRLHLARLAGERDDLLSELKPRAISCPGEVHHAERAPQRQRARAPVPDAR